jgi:hypothetical protein
VTEPRGLDPDDDPALASDRLGNLLDGERARGVLDDRGPRIVSVAAVRAGRFCSMLAIGALLCLLASVPEVRQ